MVMQERLFFRNIPLSNWIEHEMVVEEGTDLDQLPRESVFAAPSNVSSIEEGRLPISKMLDEFTMPLPKREAGALIPTIPTRAVAFGAQ
jgi:hypothetical protein